MEGKTLQEKKELCCNEKSNRQSRNQSGDQSCKSFTAKEKWLIVIIGTLAFFVFSSPIFVGAFSPLFGIIGVPLIGDQNQLYFVGYFFSGLCFLIFIRLFLH